MQIQAILTATVCVVGTAAWFTPPRNGAERSRIQQNVIESPGEFNPSDLLNSRVHKPDVYRNALIELQALKRKPSCNRLAAQMLMNDCEHLDHLEGHDTETTIHLEERLLDYIHSFASSLAICDLEAAQAAIPVTCEKFREQSLLGIAGQRGSQALHITHEEIGKCMSALAVDHTSWTSWISNRDRATLFCQASRLDIEKDQVIALYKQMTEVLQSVAEDFNSRVQQYNKDLQQQDRMTEEYFRDLHAEINNTKLSLSQIWEDGAREFGFLKDGLQKSFQEIFVRVTQVDQLIKRILQTAIETNTEQVVAHERATSMTVDLAMNTENANKEVKSLLSALPEVYLEMITLSKSVASMQERQDEIEQQMSRSYIIANNLTDALLIANSLSADHNQLMEKTAQITAGVLDHLDKATSSMSNWSIGLVAPNGPFGISWQLLVISPVMAVALGSYGLPPSVSRNVFLAVGGVVIAKILSVGCAIYDDRHHDPPASQVQPLQDDLSIIVTMPIPIHSEEFDRDSASNDA